MITNVGPKSTNKFQIIFNKKMLSMLLLGFSSGIPLQVTGNSILLWFSQNGFSIEKVGFLILLSSPYSYKFLWAPFIDYLKLPFLDKRRSWIILTQILLFLGFLSFAFLNPKVSPTAIIIIAIGISFFSATQDIAIGAYQVEALDSNQRALGSSLYVLGYRVAMWASGAVSLIIAGIYSWKIAFLFTAFLMVFGIIGLIIAPIIKDNEMLERKTFLNSVYLPFKEFLTRVDYKTGLILLFIIITYKLSDQIAFALNTIFFTKGLGYSLVEIAIAYKTTSLFASIAGTIIGGLLMTKYSLFRCFFIFCILMAVANLLYYSLALMDKNISYLTFCVFIEYFIGGLGTSALLAMILSLCNKSLSATQMALLTSIDSIGRTSLGGWVGLFVANFGWANLFLMSTSIGLFISFIIFISKRSIEKMTFK